MNNKNYNRNENDIRIDNKIFAMRASLTASLGASAFVGMKTYGSVSALTKALYSMWDHTTNNNFIMGDKLANHVLENPHYYDSNTYDLVVQNNTNEAMLFLVSLGICATVVSKFVKTESTNSLIKVYDKGLDNHLSKAGCHPRTSSEYKSELKNTLYSQSIKSFFSSCSQNIESLSLFFSKKDNRKPYENTVEYNENLSTKLFDEYSIHALHLTALLSKSNLSVDIKNNDMLEGTIFKDIMNNGDDICEILHDNIPKLNDFIDATLQSLGEDSEYLLKEFDNKGHKKEFDDLVKESILNSAKKYQNYSVHKEFCFIISDLYDLSKNGKINKNIIKENISKLEAFKEIYSSSSGSPEINNLVSLSLELSDEISKLKYSNNPNLIKKYIKDDHLKGYSVSSKENCADFIFNKLFSDKVDKPNNPQIEIKKELFSLMEKKAKAYFDSKDDFQEAKYKEPNERKKSEILSSYRLNPLGEVKSEDAAKEVILKIKQRMIQKVLLDDCDDKSHILDP